ncbi:MAG TPA: radical SAM protein [Nitrospirota bacterium]|nr:radical SAM protein [Nitrospirota bacterium]
MILREIAIVLPEIAGAAKMQDEFLLLSAVVACLWRVSAGNELFFIPEALHNYSAAAKQFFIFTRFVVCAIRSTKFTNEHLVFSHIELIITKARDRCYNNSMRYYLARRAVLKLLEIPSIYQLSNDELYELDADSFGFLKECCSESGGEAKNSAFIDYCMEEGLLTAEKTVLSRPPLEQAPQPSLRYLELQLTDACNLACKHCYIAEEPRNELEPSRVRALLGEFERMQGLRVLITGGEPLLYSKFDEINEMLPDFFLRKVLFTNGTLLDKTVIKGLKVDEIQVSIDGLEESHDFIRGQGTFRQSIGAVRNALDAGFAVSVSTMVHRCNLADFEGMERTFRELGIKDWTVDIPAPAGRLRENRDLMVDPGEGGKYLGFGYGGGLHSFGQGYGCGLHLLSVLADGRIAKCTFYRDNAIGSADEGLRAGWKKNRPVRLKELECKCEYLEVCRGGCRYRAELMMGKGAKDPYRCTLYGIL